MQVGVTVQREPLPSFERPTQPAISGSAQNHSRKNKSRTDKRRGLLRLCFPGRQSGAGLFASNVNVATTFTRVKYQFVIKSCSLQSF